jgi:hypothetical protein
VELEGSLPLSQEPTTGLCPEPNESNPQLPPYFPKMHSDFILPYKIRSCEWSLSFRFSDHNFVLTSHLPHSFYITSEPHTPCCDHSDNSWQSVNIMRLVHTHFPLLDVSKESVHVRRPVQQGYPLLAVHDRLLNPLAARLHMYRPSPPFAVRWRAMPWWQEST